MILKILLCLSLLSFDSINQINFQITIPDSIVKVISKVEKTDLPKTETNNIILKIEDGEKDWTNLWTLLAAVIIALGAYKGVILQSKASSISGFRVKWIEDLRESYSKFLIALRNVDNKVRLNQLNPLEYQKDEDAEQLQFLKSKIKLLLNHNAKTNPDHVDFWESLIHYMEDHKEFYRKSYSEETANLLDAQRVAMEAILLNIFKKEWEKAKKFG